MNELIFPETATKEERESLTFKIGSIQDEDLGFAANKKPGELKFNVRTLLINNEGLIGFIKSDKYYYHQIPGGGMNPGETIEEALKRETAEETGYTIKNIQPAGFFEESRQNILNNHSWTKAISFVYLAEVDKYVGTNYMPDEIEEGFKPVWLDLKEAISTKEKELADVLVSKESYSGTFSNYRDLTLLKFLEQNQK